MLEGQKWHSTGEGTGRSFGKAERSNGRGWETWPTSSTTHCSTGRSWVGLKKCLFSLKDWGNWVSGEKSSRRSCEAGCRQQQDHRGDGKFPVRSTSRHGVPKQQHPQASPSIPFLWIHGSQLHYVRGRRIRFGAMQRMGFGDWCGFTMFHLPGSDDGAAWPNDSSHLLQVPGVAFTF